MAGPILTNHTSFDAKLKELEEGYFLVAFRGGVSEYFRVFPEKGISLNVITIFLRYVHA